MLSCCHPIGQQLCGVLPVQWDFAGFCEIVSGASGYQAESSALAGTQYAVDCFVHAAVSAGNDYSLGALVDVLPDLLFEVADGLALVQFDRQVAALQ